MPTRGSRPDGTRDWNRRWQMNGSIPAVKACRVSRARLTGYTNIGGGTGMRILALTAIAVLGLRWRSWTPVILITIAGAGSMLMVTAGKQLIGRARPPLTEAVPPYEYTAAFPSGHALGSVVIAGIIAYLVMLRLKTARNRALTAALAVVFALTMGLSRVYLGHHWLTDVLAAWSLGLAWLALVITAHRLYLTVRKNRQALSPAPNRSVPGRHPPAP